jgi:hypothetical protein
LVLLVRVENDVLVVFEIGFQAISSPNTMHRLEALWGLGKSKHYLSEQAVSGNRNVDA